MSRSATQGWLSENGTIAYPFHENAAMTMTSAVGPVSLELPSDFILDAVFTVPVELVENVVLDSISITISGFVTLMTLVLKDPDSGDTLATLAVDSTSFGTDQQVALNVSGLLPGYSPTIPIFIGRVVVGKRGFLALANYPALTYTAPSGILFEHSVVKDNPMAKVKSLGDPFIPLTGHVQICEGYNIEITRVPEENGFRIDAILGAGLGQFCGTACEDPSVCNSAISNINGVYSDFTSFLHMIGKGAVEIKPDPDRLHGLVISTIVDPSTLCERGGIPGRPGPQGPAGGRGDKGPDGVCAPTVCPCETCEVCDSCEVDDGLKTCVTCETCDTCELEPNPCLAADIPCADPPEPFPFAGNGVSGTNTRSGIPDDLSRGRGISFPSVGAPLTHLPDLSSMHKACNCTGIAFATVTNRAGFIVSFQFDSHDFDQAVQSQDVPNPLDFNIGDTILVQTFEDGTFMLFAL